MASTLRNGINRRDFAKLGAAAALSRGFAFAPSPAPAEEIFSDRTKEAGIDFVHFNGMSGFHFYPEMMGSGVALFDYDNDGDLDIFLVQGAMLGPVDVSQAVFHPQLPLRGRLYRNDSVCNADGTCTLKFVDVTEESGIRAEGYGMGVTAADFNNDGWVDLYITNPAPTSRVGASVLLFSITTATGGSTFSLATTWISDSPIWLGAPRRAEC